eukprot:TRINITY_DN251_c2_g1_i1.p1 TRINITY_DN251_c2_g1~~TRINITY_DN251_c2_g1_i1.p1  ORF type:complete len:276 (-),score=121.83 TRINITY_DN251_c2_g1_i1:100-927(-)
MKLKGFESDEEGEKINNNTVVKWTETTFRNLRIANILAGLLHLIQGIIIVIVGNDYALPLYTFFISEEREAEPKLDRIGELQLAPVICCFELVSFVAHTIVSLPIGYEWYINNLKLGINYIRWLEYSLSASVMIIIIAILSGIYDILLLLTLFFCASTMNMCGLLMEQLNQYTPKVNWGPFLVGCLPFIAMWMTIWTYFGGAVNRSNDVPGYVVAIVFLVFCLFSCFAINMILQYLKIGPWKNYLFGEYCYIILSYVAKSLLAWILFGGALSTDE